VNPLTPPPLNTALFETTDTRLHMDRCVLRSNKRHEKAVLSQAHGAMP